MHALHDVPNVDTECEELSIENGDVSYADNFSIGSVAKYVCHSGYRREGGESKMAGMDPIYHMW